METASVHTGGRRSFVRPLVEARTYRATLHLLLDLPVGVLWFTVFTTAIATGLSLLITFVGLPILTGAFLLARGAATVERRRVGVLLGTKIPDPPARRPAKSDGILHRLAAPFRDRTTWKELAYHWLAQPVLSVVTFTVAVTVWAVPIWLLTLPVYAFEHPAAAPEPWPGFRIDTPSRTLVAAATGLVVLPLAPWAIRAFATLDALLARGLLSPSRTDALEERVDSLRETQARSVDVAIADRKQIERDLHDGAQQRLLALGVGLGMALEKFETDPQSARELLNDAHKELQQAITELRNLARGIHPAVLSDRGLDAALSGLAARSPVPVHLDVELRERPPASVEATAYFIVAEALTNVVRHAQASSADVRVRLIGDTLLVEVADDGVGGAEQAPNGGLAGLVDRAASVEGSLRITSPPGGPTVVAAELPCAS